MHTALVLEDDPLVAKLIVRELVRLGWVSVDRAQDGRAALALARGRSYGMAVLDRWVPHLCGHEVCRWLRRDGLDLPVLLITGEPDVEEAVRCGVDDVLGKPFTAARLRERVSLLHARHTLGQVLEVGAITVDRRKAAVFVAGQRVEGIEGVKLRLLTHLALHAGESVSKQELARAVWGVSKDGSNTIAVHVSQLRAALGDLARSQLKTTAHGYRLDDPHRAA